MNEADGSVRQGYLVRGRVQGVGFRWSTTRTAEELGVRGTVRNRADGAVEVHAEGPAEAMRDLEAWLREGPRAARVEGVEEIEPEDDLPPGFEIVR
jgi:acylphosphatase